MPAAPPRPVTVPPGTGGAAVWSPPEPGELSAMLPEYEVLSLLGRGGMGAVYAAMHRVLDRVVALKVLPLEVSAQAGFADRFTREARAMAKLSHPHIVAVHDFGRTAEGHLYFSMEYVEGTTLGALIHGPGPGLTQVQALTLSGQICAALAYAHGRGVVHRDMKPANVLVDQEGKAKVADFGLARLPDASEVELGHTVTGTVMGTPDYMAPEQRRGMNVDHRADIYSAGVMLYEMLCRETPHGVFRPPSAVAGCDAGVDRIVEKAMQAEPERRYQKTEEMQADLDGACRRVPGMKRKRRVSPGLMAAVVAVVAGGAGFYPALVRNDEPGGLAEKSGTVPAEAAEAVEETEEAPPANPYDAVVEAMPALMVTTAADELDPAGVAGTGRSLREALREARAGTRVTFSRTVFNGEPQDVIVLNAALGALEFQTYAVVDAEPVPGAVTLDAKGAMPTFFRNAERGGLILRRLTLQNAAGESASGDRTAAVENHGTMTLTDCTLSHNHSRGGALVNSGALTLQRCTFNDNSSQGKGGALLIAGRGARLKAANCTFTGNSATHGGAVNIGSFARESEVTFLHCTVAGNKAGKGGGGGINANGGVTLTNCIVAGNTAPVPGGENVSGEIRQGGANLLAGDARLGPLADNGGYTHTMALLPGSPAVDAGTKVRGTNADQRGQSRRAGAAADLGAYELSEVAEAPVREDGDQSAPGPR